jgi:hypothetical protein
MAHLVHQALTGQSLPEFKQAIATSLSGRAPQYKIEHYTKTTQPSFIPLWKNFGPVCTVKDNKPVVFVIQCSEDATTITKTSMQRKSSFVGCHGCATLYTYNSQTGTSALTNSHKCPVVPTVLPGGSHSMINYAKAIVLPNTGQKQLITRSLGEICASDIRPFSIVSGKGFS